MSERFTSLDGLRGIAAATVLAHHSLLLIPALAASYYGGTPAAIGSAEWWITNTPFHVLWEGKAGVYVFFVLSGFVLTLPSLREPGYEWRAYYPSRLLRLYLPAWAAVTFAILTFYVVPRVADVQSPWLQDRPTEVTLIALARDITLVAGNGRLASPLWSLTWEILFSLALPIVLWAARAMRRVHLPLALLAVATSTTGSILGQSVLWYLPMFLVGVLIALRRDAISRAAARIAPVGWWVIFIGTLVALTSRWIAAGLHGPQVAIASTDGLMLIGAATLVIMALEWEPMRRFLRGKALVTLGTLSFSLYLVHEPIVIAAGFALPDNPGTAIVLAIAVTAVVTPLFYRYVELPSHRAAKAVARKLSARPRISADEASGR